MHNINYIRENPTEFDNFMKARSEKPIANKIIEIDKVKRETQTILQNLLAMGFSPLVFIKLSNSVGFSLI